MLLFYNRTNGVVDLSTSYIENNQTEIRIQANSGMQRDEQEEDEEEEEEKNNE